VQIADRFGTSYDVKCCRERVDVRRSGKRETFTTYRVPSTAVVELPEEKRKRA
jgi:hypothetical protein